MAIKQQSKWSEFVSLKWYDGAIEFLFRFAAKTSEPLLAAGIVYSAADILSKGHLGYTNPTVNNLWAITQALAIESSGGVVLVYGLQSLKEKDFVKAWLYLILSALLAVAGGVMLFMQLAGWENQQSDNSFMLALFGLRCVVSVGYIYLCRTKHIRFTDLATGEQSVLAPNTGANTATDEAIKQLAEQVSLLTLSVTQITTTVTEVKTSVTAITQGDRGEQQAIAERTGANSEASVIDALAFAANTESEQGEQDTNIEQRIRNILTENPGLSDHKIAAMVGCSSSTANKWRKRIEQAA